MTVSERLIELRHIHPKDALREIFEVTDKVGAHAILNAPQYKREKEKFIGAVFCFIVRRLQQRECFLRQPKNDPPDFELIMPTDRPTIEKPFDVARIELVTVPQVIDKLSEDDIKRRAKAIIESKLRPTIQVPPSTTLLIFLNCSHQKTAYFGVAQAIDRPTIPYMAIWVIRILNVDAQAKEMTFAANQIFPDLANDIKINLGEEAKRGVVYNHPLLDRYSSPSQ